MQQSANIINNSTSDIYIIANQYIKKSPYKQLFGVKCRGFRCNHYNLFTCSNYEKSDNINKITISKGTNKYVNKFQKLTIYIKDEKNMDMLILISAEVSLIDKLIIDNNFINEKINNISSYKYFPIKEFYKDKKIIVSNNEIVASLLTNLTKSAIYFFGIKYIYDNFDYVSLYAFVINNIKYLIKN
jgi:hypothetical protein